MIEKLISKTVKSLNPTWEKKWTLCEFICKEVGY